jgi:hypothetical protein
MIDGSIPEPSDQYFGIHLKEDKLNIGNKPKLYDRTSIRKITGIEYGETI